MSTIPLRLSFRITIIGDKLYAWNNVIERLVDFHLCEGKDTFKWGLNHGADFTLVLNVQTDASPASIDPSKLL